MSHCLSLFDILIAVPFFTKVASVFSHVHNIACVNVYRLKYRWRCQHAGIFPTVTHISTFFPLLNEERKDEVWKMSLCYMNSSTNRWKKNEFNKRKTRKHPLHKLVSLSFLRGRHCRKINNSLWVKWSSCFREIYISLTGSL